MRARVHPDMAKLQAVCHRYDVQELALFGSALRDDFRDASDVDVLVRFRPGKRVGFLELMQEKLSQVFEGRVVNVRTFREIHPRLRAQVAAEHEVLYDLARG